MTREESLDAITHLSVVIGWLQHFQDKRAINSGEEQTAKYMLNGLVAIRESIRKDYEAKEQP